MSKKTGVAAVADDEQTLESASPTATAVAAEAMASGVVPLAAESRRHPGAPERDVLQQGDPDVDPLNNTMVGDEGVGGDMPTPDQGGIDEVGRALGVSEEDSGALRTSSEILDARDQRRQELEPPARDYRKI